MDLSSFDELEKRITGLIGHLETLRDQNQELRVQIQTQGEEIERLQALRNEVSGESIGDDNKELIRQRVEGLLKKLEQYQ